MINIQPIEKQHKSDGGVLRVHSTFTTIQGEGPFTGVPAVFVRLAGCNLQCPSCDTEYTGAAVRAMPVEDIVSTVATTRKGASLVVITGGEPFRQNISVLCQQLVRHNYKVQVETNGTLPPSENLPSEVVVVCSPKTAKVNPLMAERADCFKYVMEHSSVDVDGLPLYVLGNPSKVWKQRTSKTIYLQPVDAQNVAENEKNLNACVASSIDNGYTLQVQLHKLIGVE